MKTIKQYLPILAVAVAASLAGCSNTRTKVADISPAIRTSLDQAGFKDVTVSQDQEKGVVTLGGHVVADADKVNAAAIAQSMAPAQVVANEIGVIKPGVEKADNAINSELDKGIEHNLDAALLKDKLHKRVKYSVKNHVVTLTGEVGSETTRSRAEAVAIAVPNVHQVVNELQVKHQKATSTN